MDRFEKTADAFLKLYEHGHFSPSFSDAIADLLRRQFSKIRRMIKAQEAHNGYVYNCGYYDAINDALATLTKYKKGKP